MALFTIECIDHEIREGFYSRMKYNVQSGVLVLGICIALDDTGSVDRDTSNLVFSIKVFSTLSTLWCTLVSTVTIIVQFIH